MQAASPCPNPLRRPSLRATLAAGRNDNARWNELDALVAELPGPRDRVTPPKKPPVGRRVDVSRASTADLDMVCGHLTEAARWIRSKGIDQWPDPFPERIVSRSIERGETYVARLGGNPVGTLALSWADPFFWGDDEGNDGTAGYIHRLAIRRSHAGHGLGIDLLHWAEGEIAARGRRFVRLDCLSENTALRRFYTSAGLRERRTIERRVAHPRGATSRPSWRATLFEREVSSAGHV